MNVTGEWTSEAGGETTQFNRENEYIFILQNRVYQLFIKLADHSYISLNLLDIWRQFLDITCLRFLSKLISLY